ncbi:MAG TPA: glycosyltransferase [Anaerolineales bacterium]|nr:glycosyltransferase [Anaerolineales bacterium]HLO30393.1 glycosyltransferase [Anaerolineales bacterium]
MDRQPTVSVIIIFLNAARFIEEAVQSVFAQTYFDWELLLVDDGSSDESTRIAHQYAEQHPECVYYLEHNGHQNRGMSASRNLGIQHSQGRYVAFLDADDVWFPRKLEQQVAILEAHPQAGMVYGLSQWWYSWIPHSENQKQDFVHLLGVMPNTLIEPPALLPLFFFQQQAAIPSPSSILVRREVIEQVGGFEEAFRGEYEDQVFYAKVCLKKFVFASDECWDRYRQHPDSTYWIAQQSGQQYSARLVFLNWLAGYLDEQGVNDAKILRALQREQQRYRYPRLVRLWRNGQHLLLRIAGRILPLPMRGWLWAKWKGLDYSPPVGWVRFGSLRRLVPFSREFGFDRGLPIDRYYIEQFLAKHAADIRGHVLEVEDDLYTRQFGGARVIKSDILHVRDGAPKATIVADLTCAEDLPRETFDCIILTQTLQFIYEVRAALTTVKRILKPGGVVLATVPGISPIIRYDMEAWGQYWSFTTLSAQRLFEEVFLPANVKVEGHGNVLTAAAFLYGLAAQELEAQELDQHDYDYEVLITVRAVK